MERYLKTPNLSYHDVDDISFWTFMFNKGKIYFNLSVIVIFSFQDFRSKTVIKEAIMENDFLKNLSPSQVDN